MKSTFAVDAVDAEVRDRFAGDGRRRVRPNLILPGTQPRAVTRSQARSIVQMFETTGLSRHSAAGSTIWVVLEWCQLRGIAYVLTAAPGQGYVVERRW